MTLGELRHAALDEGILELLKHGILDDWIDDQHERGTDAPPKAGRTILGQDLFDRLEQAELLGSRRRRVREVGVRCVNRLRGLYDPDGVAYNRRRRTCASGR